MPSFDVHQHLLPESFLEALARRADPPCLRSGELVLCEGRFPFEPAEHDVEARLDALDRDEIEIAVLSLQPTLGLELLPEEERVELEEVWIAGVRDLESAAPGRFRAFAPGRMLDGFVGVCLAAAALLDDRTAAVLDELERSGGVLFVHPGPVTRSADRPEWWTGVVDYTAQMQSAYFSWLGRGRERWPTLPVVFAILAGGAPFQLERRARRGVDVRSALDEQAYFDVATYGRRAIELCIETFGVHRLVYGSDIPVVDSEPTLGAVRGFGDSVVQILQIDTPSSLIA